MALSTAAFERVGVEIQPDEIDALLAEAVAAVVPSPPLASGTELTPDEVAALQRGGVDPSPPAARVRQVLARSAAAYAALVGTAYTVAEAAQFLGIDESRVRHRLAARTLYGLRHGAGWRLPRFQFEGGTLVPGVQRVFPSLEPGMHPLAVARWFTSPDPDLTVEDVALSPRDWLLAGGDPDAVARIAGSLGIGG
jgi:hypothetical protein